MAYWINLDTFSDTRGTLTVVDQILPFEIQRLYYIYGASQKRGGHRHHRTTQALICVAGQCDVYINNGTIKQTYCLDNPSKCLIVEPQDWHTMDQFTPNAILLVASSEHYDRSDYIDEPYPS